jgi:hypothetical protein
MKIKISKLALLILLSLATNANGEFILPDGANASLVGGRARAAAATIDYHATLYVTALRQTMMPPTNVAMLKSEMHSRV